MAKLSPSRMQEIIRSKGYTYKELADLSNTSPSTLGKLFAGFLPNPSIRLLMDVATALGCEVQDFIEADASDEFEPYYQDRETAKIAQEIYEDTELRTLLDTCRDLKPEEMNAVKTLIQTMKNSKK